MFILRSHFLWKMYAGYSALILISCAIVGMITTQHVEADALTQIQQSLKTQATLLSEPANKYIELSDLEGIQKQIRSLSSNIKTRITIIRLDGVVIADSSENPCEMNNHASRPEILDAKTRNVGIATRFSDTLNAKMMYLAIPIQNGYVRTSLPLTLVDKQLRDLRTSILISAGVSAVVALLLGLFLTLHFVKPLASMTLIAEAMSRGDYEKRISTSRRDEIGTLAQALNTLASSCQKRMDTINAEKNKLSTILSGMTEGVVAIDKNECVIHLNKACAKLLKTPLDESLNKPICQITRISKICEALSKTVSEGVSSQEKIKIATVEKKQFIEMHTSALYDGQGDLVGAIAVLQDVSDIQRLETMRRDFVANASHELKTPITAIRGLAETLIDDKKLPANMRERFIKKIKSQSIRLSLIVTDLLAISRLESSVDGQGVVFDVCTVISATIKSFLSDSENSNIEIEIPSTPIYIEGDENAISQLASNLLDNAIKYTSDNGKIFVRLNKIENCAVLEVQDTGIGIEPQEQERIFERFYRVDKARSRELGGTGLGLSIVKHIALVHSGSVSVESTPSIGSTFRVSLKTTD